ncbi:MULTISPECIES: hypothetical protein [unclassified Micromonospora]|uniref:hypothetical protein n=1 Tax=unclassified Micromonospora TaxID=2617518 RepID=UPI000EF50476|nr:MULTISPECIES: hypothetical protein [unclassified Micromonospora]RLP82680.1 hypothetical protein EAD89_27950 [Micromonospora sp. BL4]RLP97868.1 hypothetical protein EAD98_06025 [Micromonospora sp. CV4]
MRHLWSFLAGLVVVPITWVLVTLGQDGSSRTVDRWVEIGTFNTANLIEPAVYLGVGGVLLGLLGTLRVSPLGPLVAGLLLVTPYVGMFVAPFEVRDAIPHGWKVLGDPLPLRLPVENGTLFLIGLLLLMAAFSRQRWQQWPRPVTEPATAPAPAGGPRSDDFTLTDWPPPEPAERDTTPPTLGYPADPTPTDPLPRRVGGESPWSAPPRGQPRPEDTTEIR